MSILANYAEQIDAMHRRAVDAASDAGCVDYFERKLSALLLLRDWCQRADPLADALTTSEQCTEDGPSLGAMMVDLASGMVADIEGECAQDLQNALPYVARDIARADGRRADRGAA